jgi:hypothetical protein
VGVGVEKLFTFSVSKPNFQSLAKSGRRVERGGGGEDDG